MTWGEKRAGVTSRVYLNSEHVPILDLYTGE